VSLDKQALPAPTAAFRVGSWLVEPSLNRLTRGDEVVQLELKAMDVLLCLAARAGEAVSKEELIDVVWRTEFVGDNVVARRVSDLRHALEDDARAPTYIETIPKRGYRLIAAVAEVVPAVVAPFPDRVPAARADPERSPYPGLAAFTEADAAYFFGRDLEVARLWRSITSRRLLAVVGPSGVGKSSFLRAGVLAAAPAGWGALVCHPGDAPVAGLARALVPSFAGDVAVLDDLVDLRDCAQAAELVGRWRERHDRALLVVDQFEELFTLNPPEVQTEMAELLGRLAQDGGLHVVLSMRDDFLYACHAQPALAPVFQDVTPLAQPRGAALEQALVGPAERCGYAFEDQDLVAEIVVEVAEERGALPLMAFAVARLWEERDRDRRLLTRAAYERLGGVGGALARHAEHTLTVIGEHRLSVVRELLRNLVTAQGTRAVRDLDELRSVFDRPDAAAGTGPDRAAAEEVLGQLIDARLLTTYAIRHEPGERRRRVEVVHESLLRSWPRLVRWQTQDADAARLRDQLRQAARLWQERGRPDDLLWRGSAFKEFEVWREGYPGGLSTTEQAFARAMAELAGRRRRRRRAAVAAVLALATVVSTALGLLWRRSVHETRRAESSRLVALGHLRLDSYPSAALAHAMASLELADSHPARRLALEALWQGPTALVADREQSFEVAFSQDGRRLVQSVLGIGETGLLRLFEPDGSSRALPQVHESGWVHIGFMPGGELFYTHNLVVRPVPRRIVLWSAADGRPRAEARYPGTVDIRAITADSHRVLLLVDDNGLVAVDAVATDGAVERLGSPGFGPKAQWYAHTALSARWLAAVSRGEVLLCAIGQHRLGEVRSLGRLDGAVAALALDPAGRWLATAESSGSIVLWDLATGARAAVLGGPAAINDLTFTPDGSRLVVTAGAAEQRQTSMWTLAAGSHLRCAVSEADPRQSWVWSLDGPRVRLAGGFDRAFGLLGPGGHAATIGEDARVRVTWPGAPHDAEPQLLRRGEVEDVWGIAFNPGGRWLASADHAGVALWPLARPYPAVIRRHADAVNALAFAPDGQWLASSAMDGTVRLWPLVGRAPPPGRVLLHLTEDQLRRMAISPDGEQLLVASDFSGMWLVSTDGMSRREMGGFRPDAVAAAFSPDGRLAAGTSLGVSDPTSAVILVWDAATWDEVAVLQGDEPNFGQDLAFTADGHVLSTTESGLRQWDLEAGGSELLYRGRVPVFAVSDDRRKVVLVDRELGGVTLAGRAVVVDLASGATLPLASHGDGVHAVALDESGEIAVTGGRDGIVRVGAVAGGPLHLLIGHERRIRFVAVDPRSRWIASCGADATVRLWPMPDLASPPLHTLPRRELLTRLGSLTNVRVVRDPGSATGWKITAAPFPGWQTTPTW
jgi:WD40 repeat protein/DNA-binding winged helix-turn-helix (wHTH) protein